MRRVIGLIDMDCFYAQVEQREKPNLWGKPVIVVQHSRAGVQGGILAVSYEARSFGVKRGMNVVDAKSICPDLNVCHVPIGEYADKADIQKYRDASSEVFEILNNFDATIIVEKASVDEAFLDLSVYVEKNLESEEYQQTIHTNKILNTLTSSHVADGFDLKETNQERVERLESFAEECKNNKDQLRLLIGAQVLEEIRKKILENTQFHCSAGIATNKMMAKLVCARHKPRQQTIVPVKFAKEILKTTPVENLRGFGGKMGVRIKNELGITNVGQILDINFSQLYEAFPEDHERLISVAEGFDDELVKPRGESSSIAVSKNFPGKNSIGRIRDMKYWLEGLIKELAKRLVTDQIKNKRTAENLVYSILSDDGKPQKTLKITSYNPNFLIEQVWRAVKTLNKSNDDVFWYPKVQNIYVGATRFVPGISNQSKAITEWISKKPSHMFIKDSNTTENNDEDVVFIEEIIQPSTSETNSYSVTTIDNDKQNNDENYINVDGKRFSKTAFKMLNPVIKRQYEHLLALESAKKLKENSKSGKVGKRKQQRSVTEAKKSKPLTSFFNKKP